MSSQSAFQTPSTINGTFASSASNITIASAVQPSSSSASSPQSSASPANSPVQSTPISQIHSHLGGLHAGAIIGICLGTLAAILLVAWVLFFHRRRAQEKPRPFPGNRLPWRVKRWVFGDTGESLHIRPQSFRMIHECSLMYRASAGHLVLYTGSSKLSGPISSTWSWFGSVPIDWEHQPEPVSTSLDLPRKTTREDADVEHSACSPNPSSSRYAKTQLSAWEQQPGGATRLSLPPPVSGNPAPRATLPLELLTLADSVYAVAALIARSRKSMTSMSEPLRGGSVERSILEADEGTALSRDVKNDVETS